MNNINTKDIRIKLIDFFRNDICKNCSNKNDCSKEFYCEEILKLFEDLKNDVKINIRRTIKNTLGKLNVYFSNDLLDKIIELRGKNKEEYFKLISQFEYFKNNYILIAGNLSQIELIQHNQLIGIDIYHFYNNELNQGIKELFDYLRNNELWENTK